MSQVYYRHSKNGEVYCYDTKEQREQFGPKELVPMSAAEVKAHLAPASTKRTREQVEVMRLVAYADPVTGCDRYKAEAYAERLAGNESKALEADAKLAVRREEIKAANPWPKDD